MSIYRDRNKVAISRLKSMLSWSDRIGSDERHEINLIIKVLDELPDESK